ncbi:hypothetical protein OF83DRAFT_488844 [Amylostereum chailletii]|nr:hypothetical protein OF83DRAFT_488844 [Amylostereum chailletii]
MEKPPFSFTRHLLLPDILLVALVATDPPTVVRVLGFGLLIHAFVTTPGSTTGDPSNDYSLGFLLGMQVFTALRFLWLERPLDVLRHERDTQSPREMAIWRRIYWAFCLDHSVRAVGWTHQVKHVPPRPRTRPAAFVRRCLVHALFNYLIADAAHTYARTIAPIHSQGSILRASVGASWIPVIYASVNVQYFVLAALSVTFHVGRPEDWPDVFGRWADAYTLRKFWGYVPYQFLGLFHVAAAESVAVMVLSPCRRRPVPN